MENTIAVALSHQLALRDRMDVIAGNIANANTTGYKQEQLLFETYLADLADGSQLLMVDDVRLARDYGEGPLEPTANPLDVAIEGDAFFEVETAEGPRYTRGGHFRLDADGGLVTASGDAVLDAGGLPILTIPGDSEIEIAADGTVSSESGDIGRLALVSFDDPSRLQRAGSGLYTTDQTPQPATDATVLQGFLEGSNVEPVIEMTRMISVVRSYQAAQRLAQDQDELLRQSIDTLGGGTGA